ncbi:polyphosphate polymerase domain-containing protein [Pelagibacteraceae bacterium]|jgi:hypothetical protein|nr:polyphosphate polymerase domain-containing protein [Pelagibacteraceae bacterium]MDC0952732.1 polyphosphate polymerase domain-containing protein [Pelagibacteraceae bacterium]
MKENKTLQRYEFKYFLRKRIAEEIQDHASKFMLLDSHAHSSSNNQYFVRSIYFEDDFNSNFDEKVDGHRVRKKFRLRYYSRDLNSGPVFLETKGRNLERTYKRRVTLNHSDTKIIKDKKFIYSLLSKYPENSSIQEFVFEFYKKKLKPKVLVDYNRQPYVNKHGLYFRLTFDHNLSCINLNNNFENILKNQSVLCKAGYTILEVKFDRSIPLWFHRIIQTYNLRRQSISKFVLGMCYSKLGKETSD